MNVTNCTVGKKLCSRPCFVRPVIAQNTARLRISLRNSRRTTVVAGESFSACSTPTAFRSRFFRQTVENLKVAYETAITRRKLTIPSFQPSEVPVHRLYTEADGPKGPFIVHLSCSPSFVFPRATTRRNTRTSDPHQAY